MTLDSKKYLPPEVLARISRLEILARNVVEGFLNGMHRSPYYGQSIEFAQHREYVAGDDTRRIDWKVWSKTDKYYLKLYEEETNLRTKILVDLSESMEYKSQKISKAEYACSIAACLSYLMLKQQDAVGVTVFDDQIQARTPISSQQSHLHAILSVLHQSKPSKKTSLQTILEQTANDFTRRGLIVLISDLFSDREGLYKGLKLLRHRGHDVMIFHILDDQELDFDFQGTTKFVGLEETGELTCDPKSLRQGYIDAMQEFLSNVNRTCAANLVDYNTIRTSQKLDAVLSEFMKSRVGFKK